MKLGYGVQEIVPFEPQRPASIHRRKPQAAEPPLQFANCQPEIFHRFDVAADPQVNPGPGTARYPVLSRRMSTPTSRAPRIAPGLLTRTCTAGTGNSSRINAAIFSASVSTSWKLDSPTNCCTRLAIAL